MAAQNKVPYAGATSRVRWRRARVVVFHPVVFLVLAGLVFIPMLLTTVPARSAENAGAPKSDQPLPSPAMNQPALTTAKPESGPKKTNLQKTQNDAAELSTLADQLRDELNKMNANVFSLDVLQKTEQVEKLARKIKGEAKP